MDPSRKPSAGDIFKGKSDAYSQHRPRYPHALIPLLEEQIAFSPMDVVTDIGSGTGLLSRLFIENGNTVYGVEPNDEMRSVSSAQLRAFPNFHAVKGTGEATGLEAMSSDLIVCGQSFHWLEPESAKKEFRRLLHREGHVALIWNDRLPGETGFNSDYEKICREYSPKYHSSGSTVLSQDSFGHFFDGAYREFELENYQDLTLEGVKGRYLSASYALNPEDENYGNLMQKIEEAFSRHEKNGVARIQYKTKIYLGEV